MISEQADTEQKKSLIFIRYLGVDVRPRGFGFVVIENTSVLDSGTRMCDRCGFENCLEQRFARILQAYIPSIVIIRTVSDRPSEPKRLAILKGIKNQTKQHEIEVVRKGPAAIRRHFGRRNANTKYEIAQAVTTILPELAWKLPRKRRAWETENHRMSIFDAAAAVVAFVESGDDLRTTLVVTNG